ncbi:histone deacetylase [Streptomyces halobius]|uniref:Histone deacetylase n=1 Tax=Streptomyces halobius TaxID=2879846 RepID=A0ABY4M452_9ACTN|nr:histone deacetylase [Streptomyces halobius]UQA92242.1 histone deacetylase [Streptomyces halobius]
MNRETVRSVWYAAYGSNMRLERLVYYLAGGRPPGGRRTYPGCRDPRRPARSVPVMLPGLMYFATESPVWTGGRAFYDPDGHRHVPSRAHLLTPGQFSDIAAQEMYREPGQDLDLTEVLTHGRAQLGPGRYETLVCTGELEGYPLLTFTAPWRREDVTANRPAAAYLRHLVAGIVAAHGWSARRAAEYLAGCPGAEGEWTVAEIAALVAERS